MMPEEKAKQLKSQFGDNARYVCLEIIDFLKAQPNYNEKHFNLNYQNILYWNEVKNKI